MTSFTLSVIFAYFIWVWQDKLMRWLDLTIQKMVNDQVDRDFRRSKEERESCRVMK